MKYTIEWLREQKGELKFIFFGGGFLSQWYSSPFKDSNGQQYLNSEQFYFSYVILSYNNFILFYFVWCYFVCSWMMAEKARLFGDKINEEKILNSKAPAQMQYLGIFLC
jgi:predicted NAD-dependent protein-ADP-ribosyltransferase YbiA (DUF1768 family)